MGLELNLDDITLKLSIRGYKKPSEDSWSDEWCKVDLSVEADNWLNYCITNREMLLCCEIDALIDHLKRMKDKTLKEKTFYTFCEPDLEFIFYPEDKTSALADLIINFWDKEGALTANHLSLTLDTMDISNLYNYLRHVQSKSKEEYIPVTLDGLTEEQIDECLEEAYQQSLSGETYTWEEIKERLNDIINQPPLENLDDCQSVYKRINKRHLLGNAFTIFKAQKAFEGVSEELGVTDENDVQDLVDEVRYGDDS